MLTDDDMPEGYLLLTSTPTEMKIVDRKLTELYLKAELEDGELWFYVQTETDLGKARSFVRGSKLFDLMIEHFGDEVVAIVGFWTDGPNWEEFHANIRAGVSEKESANNTWTGRLAGSKGFSASKVEIGRREGLNDCVNVRFQRNGGSS